MTPSPPPRTVVEIVREDMDRALDAMRAELARSLYRSDPELFTSCRTPQSRWLRGWWGLRGYVQTLWDALRGVDLVEREED